MTDFQHRTSNDWIIRSQKWTAGECRQPIQSTACNLLLQCKWKRKFPSFALKLIGKCVCSYDVLVYIFGGIFMLAITAISTSIHIYHRYMCKPTHRMSIHTFPNIPFIIAKKITHWSYKYTRKVYLIYTFFHWNAYSIQLRFVFVLRWWVFCG